VQPGEVIREAWQLYKAQWRHLLPLALVVYLALSLISLALAAALGWVGAIAGGFVSLAGIFWLQGALVEAVADVRDGRADLSIGETLRRVQPRIWAIAAAGILAALGILVGLVLLIVPGLVLLTWWSLILPVIVLERTAVMESFGRSRGLVRGNGWNVFGVIVLTILLLIAVSIVVAIALLWVPEEIRTYVTDVVGNTLTAPFIALAWTLMYYRLREPQPAAEPPPAVA
jgi:hypothetical protein